MNIREGRREYKDMLWMGASECPGEGGYDLHTLLYSMLNIPVR